MPLAKSRYPLRPGEKYDFAGRIICLHGERRMYCKVCVLNRNRAARANRPDVDLRSQLKGYGVTLEWYQAKLTEQNGLCAVCRRPERQRRNGKLKRLAVDHNHETGEARGLICSSCNMKVGVLEDATWRAQAREYCVTFAIADRKQRNRPTIPTD